MANCSQNFSSNSSSCLCQTHTSYLVLPILYTTMFLIGLSGNFLSLWVFMVKISSKTATHIYLINIGISNLILCLAMPFTAAYYALGTGWTSSSLKCQLSINILTPVLHVNIRVGMLILTWLALSRFATFIQHAYGNRPSKCTKYLPRVFFSRLQQTKFALKMCLGTWAILVIMITPTMIINSVTETQQESEQPCYSVAVEVGGFGSQLSAIVGIIMFFLCLLLVLSTYTAVIRHLRRISNSSAIADRKRIYSRVVRNIVVIQSVLVICLLPYHIYKAIFINMAQHHSQSGEHGAQCHPLSVYVEAKSLLLCLAVLRCSIDPIVCFLLDRTFKKYAYGLFGRSANTQDNQSLRTLEFGQCNQYDMTSKGAVTLT